MSSSSSSSESLVTADVLLKKQQPFNGKHSSGQLLFERGLAVATASLLTVFTVMVDVMSQRKPTKQFRLKPADVADESAEHSLYYQLKRPC